ncbi:hypothetical protein [Streptomyces sp. NPDC048248]|uniref:hypothetical protein n=1 Tax=Streptomyces sp. NPDC048248 TaxID=3365523 RepID=UPI0037173EBF
MVVAPRFRSRIATSLLVLAAVLPLQVAVTTATASDQQRTPVDRPPHLGHPQDRPDAAPADLPLAGSRAGVGRGHPGRPGAPAGFADDWDPVPEMPDFPELPDLLPAFPDPPSHLPGAPKPHHPSPPPTDVPSPPESAQEPPDEGSDAPAAESPQPSEPTGLPEADDVQIPPAPAEPSPAPSPPASKPAPTKAAPAKPPRRPEARERFVAPGAPRQTPGASEGQGDATQDGLEAGPAAEGSPYTFEAPEARVERVLPMGTGLALTGLGLAFLGLRLRRR